MITNNQKFLSQENLMNAIEREWKTISFNYVNICINYYLTIYYKRKLIKEGIDKRNINKH